MPSSLSSQVRGKKTKTVASLGEPSVGLVAPLEPLPPVSSQVVEKTRKGGKKTKTVVRLDDLPQGLAQPSEPLPPFEDEPDEPAYPTVVLEARRNMQKFNDCVVLTRVGGFYELYLEQAEEFGPLLNLKVAQKKTSVALVPMVWFCSAARNMLFHLSLFVDGLMGPIARPASLSSS